MNLEDFLWPGIIVLLMFVIGIPLIKKFMADKVNESGSSESYLNPTN